MPKRDLRPPPPLGPGRTPAPPTRASRLTDAPGASRTHTPKGGRTCTRVCRHLAAGFGKAHPLRKNTPGASAAPQRPPAPCTTPGHKMQTEGQQTDTAQATSQQPGPAGHLNTGSPAPCGFGQMDTQAPARPCPHPRKICRDGRGQRCHLNRGRAADTGQPAQLDTSTPGQIRPQ